MLRRLSQDAKNLSARRSESQSEPPPKKKKHQEALWEARIKTLGYILKTGMKPLLTYICCTEKKKLPSGYNLDEAAIPVKEEPKIVNVNALNKGG